MENASLQTLLEGDREMILANLARDRAPGAAQDVLEKAVDRVMYRYVEQCEDPALRDDAQLILQTVKNTLPVIDAVGEARQWRKSMPEAAKSRPKLKPLPVILLIVGLALSLTSLLAGQLGLVLGLLQGLLFSLLGGACLFASGFLLAKPAKAKANDAPEPEMRTEFLVDSEKTFHRLKAAMLMADASLENLRAEHAVQAQREAAREGALGGPLPAGEIDLLSALLEDAYSRGDDQASETISSIRFYLHQAQISVVDYEKGRENWFEWLPAQHPGTIRPALAAGDRLLKKGLAAS